MAVKKGKVPVKKYFNTAFENLHEDKRNRVISAAVKEFAGQGYDSANINVIAEQAGISIGSMYKYFSSKENLFLSVIEIGYELLEKVIVDIDQKEGNIFDKIENMLTAAQQYSIRFPELTQIYLDLTSEGMSKLSAKLSSRMESISAKFYKNMLVKAKQDGLINKDIDEELYSFCLDNIILMIQFSYVTVYLKKRMKIFCGDKAANDALVIKGIMTFLRAALTAPTAAE